MPTLNERVRALGPIFNVVELVRELLIFCREHVVGLLQLRNHDDALDALDDAFDHLCKVLEDLGSETLDSDDLDSLFAAGTPYAEKLGDVGFARALALALDEVLGERFVGLFMGRRAPLTARSAVPIVPVFLPSGASARPESLGIISDSIRHLGILPDDLRPVSAVLDGTHSHELAPLKYGARTAIGIPNTRLEDFTWDIVRGEGRARFFNVRPKD